MTGGMSASTMICFGSTPRMMRPAGGVPLGRRQPNNARSATSRLPIVAESPQVGTSGHRVRSRASASSTWTPRFVPISSCHSSTTMSRRSRKTSVTSSRVSSSVRLSGVVTSVSGNRRCCRARCAGTPNDSSGSRNDAAVSAASARSGVTQTARRAWRVARDAPRASEASMSGPNHAARVFPVPVAACTSPLSPAR